MNNKNVREKTNHIQGEQTKRTTSSGSLMNHSFDLSLEHFMLGGNQIHALRNS